MSNLEGNEQQNWLHPQRVDTPDWWNSAVDVSVGHLRAVREDEGQVRIWDFNEAAEKGFEYMGLRPNGPERAIGFFGLADEQLRTLYEDRSPITDSPGWELLRLSSATEGGVKVTPQVLPLAHILDRCFPQDDEAWRQQVGIDVSTIVKAMARVKMREGGQQVLCDSEGNKWIEVADLTRSLPRSFFRTPPPEVRVAADTLGKLTTYPQPGKHSRILREALAISPTGIFDMDIVYDGEQISIESVLGDIFPGYQTYKTDGSSSRNLNLALPTGTRVSVKVVPLESKKAAHRLVLRPQNGPAFSVDLMPRSLTPEDQARDFRSGPHQSSKKNTGTLHFLVNAEGERKEEVGVSGSVDEIIDGIAETWLPTGIDKPRYTSVAQAALATLSAMRVELSSPSSVFFQDKAIVDMTASDLFKTVLASLMKDPKLEQKPSLRRAAEVVREGLVLLCMDKQWTIQMIRKIGLDHVLRVADELASIEKMDQRVFNSRIIGDPVFANYCADMFNLQRATQKPYPQSKILTPHKRRVRPAETLLDATALVDRHTISPENWNDINRLTIPELIKAGYMIWPLEPVETIHGKGTPTKGQLTEAMAKIYDLVKNGETEASLCLLNQRSENPLGVAVAVPDGKTFAHRYKEPQEAESELYRLVPSLQVSEMVISARRRLFPSTILTDALQAYHRFVDVGDAFYSQRITSFPGASAESVVGIPPAILRFTSNSDCPGFLVTLTCPFAVNPSTALTFIQKMIGHRSGIKEPYYRASNTPGKRHWRGA